MMRRLNVALLAIAVALPAAAADYRSVDVPAAILYDAPSQKAKKLYLIRAQTPVEVVVRLEGWAKVRDAEGTLAWIEAAQLAERRTLIVTEAGAELRASDKADAPVLARFDKWVVLEHVAAAAPGWVQVRHRDGVSGMVRATQVWGL
ncbi:SH3 domain-containing protein [Azonexus fungiphilus]|uniref:SH3 domain-containing protein n=2 Tax=Azonexus fungiphilus TaxID=146940 RepID=A0A495WN11_9RHOO|nr:SH3 domain-containing protein [Azonexus fungiphilus]